MTPKLEIVYLNAGLYQVKLRIGVNAYFVLPATCQVASMGKELVGERADIAEVVPGISYLRDEQM